MLGQAQQLFTTAGNSGSATGVHLDYSIGEPIIVTHIHAQHQITQGFQQPLRSNTDPVFSSTPDTYAVIGTAYSYSITAADPDGDALTFTGTTIPSWLTLTDNGNNTATLTGTPTVGGTYNIVITVDDGNGGTATQSFDITSGPLITVANGNWSDPAIWSSGAVPTAGQAPTIAHDVTVDVNTVTRVNHCIWCSFDHKQCLL